MKIPSLTDCYGNSLLRCSAEKCISDVFRDDKILNCPPPGCSDESDCINNEKPRAVSIGGGGVGGDESHGVAHIVIPLVVLIIAAFIGILCFYKKNKSTTNSQGADGDHVEELRPTTRSDLDSYLEFQDVRPIPMVPEQQPYRPAEDNRTMPLVPPEERYDRPMPSAPPSFKDDPPPYDALFSSNQTKRANV